MLKTIFFSILIVAIINSPLTMPILFLLIVYTTMSTPKKKKRRR